MRQRGSRDADGVGGRRRPREYRHARAERRTVLGARRDLSGLDHAPILTVLDSLLTILDASQAVRQILYGAIVLALASLYARTAARD